MIRLLEGKVYDLVQNGLIVTVSGVGYLVHTTKKLAALPNDEVVLFTYLAVRENALDLYGFLDKNELSMFELLLTIPKIGPKSALQILDQADTKLLLESINLGDATHLSKLSSISKKTAEKIVSELANKVDSLSLTVKGLDTEAKNDNYNDAFDTLITMGYNTANIRKALENEDLNSSTSTLVKIALQKLS